MLVNPEALEPNFWETVSYEAKTDELLSLSNNMNWGLEELADELEISKDHLMKFLSLEEIDDDFLTQALLKLFPVLEQRLQEHKRNIQCEGNST